MKINLKAQLKPGDNVMTVVGPMQIKHLSMIRTINGGEPINIWECISLNKNGSLNKKKIHRFFQEDRLTKIQ